MAFYPEIYCSLFIIRVIDNSAVYRCFLDASNRQGQIWSLPNDVLPHSFHAVRYMSLHNKHFVYLCS